MSDQSEEQSVVEIDEDNLDKECIRIPSDYLKFAHQAVNAKRDVDEAKARLDVIEAELSKEIRAAPADFGIEKVTETAITGAITMSPRYQKSVQKLNEFKHKAELAQAVVWALEHKKRSLTLLVELHGLGYFSSPKISKEGKQAVEDMTKRKVRRFHEDD